MSQNEETVVKSILKSFVSGTVPEYILDGSRSIVAAEGVQRLDLKKRERYWDIDASIQGEDFQIYSSELGLNLAEESINYYCNCPESFSGVCKHVGAAALKLLLSLDSEEEKAESQKQIDWRQNFRSFFATELEPEAGKHYIIYRMYPEPERLQVAFFRARQNKSGLSQVQNEIELANIIEKPEWSETSPNLPLVGEQIGHFLDYRGHRVDIPAGLHAWFFTSIKDEYYLFYEIQIFRFVLKAGPCNSSCLRNFPKKVCNSISSFLMKENLPSPLWMTMRYSFTADCRSGYIGNKGFTRFRQLLRLNWCRKCVYRIQ